MSKAERERAAQRVVIQWQASITEMMRDALFQAVKDAKFSRDTFDSFLNQEFKVSSIDELTREQFLPVCRMIVTLNEAIENGEVYK